MKIVVAVRCYNNLRFAERFLRGYDFADEIVISDGGSTDGSVEFLEGKSKVHLLHFDQYEEKFGRRWNPDNPHMEFVLNYAKSLDPDWLIFDDFDCVPNKYLRDYARDMFEAVIRREHKQVNVFRLYLWNSDQYFPFMNRSFDPAYTSLWAWRPKEIDIHANLEKRHGTLVGLASDPYKLEIPMCLLHKSWDNETINEKIDNYTTFGIEFGHPFTFAGEPKLLPGWAVE